MSKPKLHDNKSFVPCEILFYIFTSLPAKSLLRFQSVSTSWNARIHEKRFKKAHRKQSKALGRVKFLSQRVTDNEQPGYRRIPGDQFELIGVGELVEFNVYDYPIIIENLMCPLKSAQVLCSDDCLLLLRNKHTFVLWNPSTRQHKTLVCPYLNNSESSKFLPYACGLCYDSTADDYKVILIYLSFYVVYSMNSDLWTMKNLPIRFRVVEKYSYSCCEAISTQAGCLYWSLKDVGTRWANFNQHLDEDSVIIYFDVKSDELKELPMPDLVSDDNEMFTLSSLKGCLSIDARSGTGIWIGIWIMEQDGIWIFKELSFGKCGKLLFCKGNGEEIYFGPIQHHLSVYNPKQKKHATTFYVSDNTLYVDRPEDRTCWDNLYMFS